jgi:hypothetical protein
LRRFLRLDTAGKELRSFPVYVQTSGGRIDILSGGRILVPEKAHNRVVEYSAEGRIVWQITFEEPVAAVRLPNGNTLVTAFRDDKVVELDRNGREVHVIKAGKRVTRAFRR